MFMKILYCILIFITLFDSNFATHQLNSSSATSLSKVEAMNNVTAKIEIDKIASELKSILTKDQILLLIKHLIPTGYVLKSVKYSKLEDTELTSTEIKEVYEDTVSRNLTKVPINQLLHLPELLSNATHLRAFKNPVHSVRPIRPRRHIKCRNPSNIPGASSYFVYEKVLEKNDSELDVTDE